MRIAYISYECPPDSSHGGIGTYVAQAARAMAKRGHSVEVFASSAIRNESAEDDGVAFHWINETHREEFGVIAGHRFAARHRVSPFDVVEGPEFFADARKAVELVPDVALLVRMHTPSNLVMELNFPRNLVTYSSHFYRNLRTVFGNVLKHLPVPPLAFNPAGIEWGRKLDAMERAHAQGADLIVPPTKSLCDYAIKRWGIPAERVHQCPYSYEPARAMMDISTTNSALTVGFVGRLERRKGVETLAQAIPMVLKENPQVRFRFVGQSTIHAGTGKPYDQWLNTRLRNFAGNLEFAGKVDLSEMPMVYAGLDVCVFPSLWENFPNVCLEAMSAARAIVATTGGGMEEMLDGGRCGTLIPPNSPAALASSILLLLRDDQLRRRFGAASRARVLEVYNATRVGALMEKLFEEAIRRKRSSSK